MLTNNGSMERKKSDTFPKMSVDLDFWDKFLRLYTFNLNDQFLKRGLLEIRTFCLVRTAFDTFI